MSARSGYNIVIIENLVYRQAIDLSMEIHMSKEHIQDVVLQSLQEYFKDLDGQKPTDIYNMIIHTVEKPVLVAVMTHAKNNQSHAAEILGINRNTLRKKLLEHKLL